MYPPVFLIHVCDIVQARDTGKVDSLGNRIITETTIEDVKCRFTGVSGKDYGYVTTAKCTLAGRTDVYEDDKVTTDQYGLAEKYWVNVVRQVFEPTTAKISHTILELRETPERVRNGS